MCLCVCTHSNVWVLVCITYTHWCQKRNLIASLHLNTCVHWISCSFMLAGLQASREPPVPTSLLIIEPWIIAHHCAMSPYRDHGLQHTTILHPASRKFWNSNSGLHSYVANIFNTLPTEYFPRPPKIQWFLNVHSISLLPKVTSTKRILEIKSKMSCLVV